MAKIDFKVSADTDKAIADLTKVVNKQEQTIDKLKKTNIEGRKTKSVFSGITGEVAKMAAGFMTAQGLMTAMRNTVGLIRNEFEAMVQKQTEAAQGVAGYNQLAIEAIRMHQGITPDLDKQVAAIRATADRMPTVGPKEAAQLYETYAGAYPTADVAQSLKAVELGGGPVSPAGRKQLVELAGQIGRLMPDKAVDDTFDLAAQFLRDAGERADSIKDAMQGISKMVELGADPEEMLSRLTVGLQKKLKPRVFSTLATLTSTVMDKADSIQRKPGTRLTEEQEMVKRVGSMSADDMMRWLDEADMATRLKVFGPTFASVGPAFGPGVAGRGLSVMQSAQARDINRIETDMLRRSKAGSMVVGGEMAKVAGEEAIFARDKDVRIGQMRQAFQEFLPKARGLPDYRRRLMEVQFEAEGLAFGDYYGGAESVLGQLQDFYGPTVEGGGFTYGGGGYMGAPSGRTRENVPNPNANEAMLVAVEKLIKAIDLIAGNQRDMREAGYNPGTGID